MRRGRRAIVEEEEEQRIYRGWDGLPLDLFYPIFFSPEITVEDVLLRARKGLIYLWLIDPELALRIMKRRTELYPNDPKYMRPEIYERISQRGPRLERIWRNMFAWKYARQPLETPETNDLWGLYTEFMPNRYLRCLAWLCFKALRTRNRILFRSPRKDFKVLWEYGDGTINHICYQTKILPGNYGFCDAIADTSLMSQGDFAELSIALTRQWGWISPTPYIFVKDLPTKFETLIVPCFYLLLMKKWRYEYKTMDGIEKKVW